MGNPSAPRHREQRLQEHAMPLVEYGYLTLLQGFRGRDHARPGRKLLAAMRKQQERKTA